jgi:penicillin-binding protein 2
MGWGGGLNFPNGRDHKRWPSDVPRAIPDGSHEVNRKLFFLSAVIFIVFGIMTAQLAHMQLIDGETYAMRAETNRLRTVALAPSRGLIYDRNGVPLVANEASFAAAVVAADIPEERQTDIAIVLQELLGTPATEIEQQIQARRDSNDPFTPLVIEENLPEATAFALRQRLADLPGVRVIIEPERRYLEPELMAHILGFVGPIDGEEYARLATAGYQMDDRIGKAGIELSYEANLRGKPGVKSVEADASGREMRTISQTAADPGDSLVLSIDLELQREVTRILQESMGASKNASAIVMDVNSGEILAMVSLPSYNTNVFGGDVDEAEIARLLNDPGKPLLNHAIAEMYAPGSTFKQITGLAALQEGVANANTLITSNGYIQVRNEFDASIVYTFRDWRSDLGTMNFYRGLAMSSDVYFYYLAGGYSEGDDLLFQGLGADRLADWARRFGLGSPTGLDIPGESEGLVPDPEWKTAAIGDVWVIGDSYNFGIGQGYVAATPIQMVVTTAAVANGGTVLVPHLVHEVVDIDGNTVIPPRRTVKNELNADPRNIDILHEAMRQAVADGSAFTAASENVTIAGKTGTAEFGQQRPDGSYQEHGWFTGFAPYDNPEIAVVVFHEQGNGAGTAAPAASKIFDYFFTRQVRSETP